MAAYTPYYTSTTYSSYPRHQHKLYFRIPQDQTEQTTQSHSVLPRMWSILWSPTCGTAGDTAGSVSPAHFLVSIALVQLLHVNHAEEDFIPVMLGLMFYFFMKYNKQYGFHQLQTSLEMKTDLVSFYVLFQSAAF